MAESDQVHNYAYPAVASWLHSTSLAQLDGPSDPRNADDPLDASPDDFYKSAFTTTTTTTQHDIAPPPADMAATRQRQPVANGAARPPPRSAPRCVSGPAPSTLSTAPGHASPPVSNKVKALAERFEQSPGAAAPAVRSRSKGPGRVGGYNPARHSNASASASASSTASAPRPSKEAQYGSYTLNTLKPRERPQPAPATPRNAPNTRRTTGSRSSLHHHASPSRNKAVASPTRKPASSGRQLFFGEVVSGQDVAAPGFGIPTHQSLEEEIPGVGIILKSAARRERLPAATFKPPHHERSRSVATSTPSQRDIERASVRPSPASKIPVRRRRLSATSDTTSSSTRSVRYTPTRASNHSHRASPTRSRRKLLGAAPTADLHGADPSILPPLAYRGYRERRKSLAGPRGGPAIASDPPLSPRLPKSREREFLQPSPGQSTRASDAYGDHGYFPNEPLDPSVDSSTGPQEFAIQSSHQKDDPYAHPHPTNHHSGQPAHEEHQNSSSGHQQRLSLQTGQLSLPPPQQQPLSATTDFEESPILGVPGSFVLTPPTGHEEQHPQPLQPTVVYPSSRKQAPTSPEIEQSELGVRESIPIMLSDEQSSQPRHSGSEAMGESLQALTYGYPMDRSYRIDGMQPASHYHRDDSPIDPFGNRDSLQPEDSASSAPCRAAAPIAFNTETYSVVNSVLNMYHQSPVISPELASVSRQRVHKVSPVIAQHKDWGSKEATETYLARLLSDANGGAGEQVSRTQRMTSPSRPAVTVPHAEEAPGIDAGGTAIIYPPQSRRYSRGSRGSTTTTIQDDASRSGSSSGLPSQNHTMHSATTDPFSNNGIELPQLAWTNGGLGLSYDEDLPPSPSSQQAPPRPAYSPPPPPMSPSSDQHTTPLDTTQPPFSHQYPRPTAINEHIDLHPARAPAPGSLPNELGLEARYGSPAMEDVDQAIAPRASVDHGQPDLAKQALIKRYRILEELLTTEHQFCIDMMIAHNIFEATAQSVMTEKEKKVLFSNCKELEKFSLSLFRAFKKAAKPIVKYDIPPPTGPWNRDSTDSRPSNSDAPLNIRRPSEDLQNQFENCTPENDHLTAVGQVFLENKEKMERLYTTYFLNQENAAAYIKKHQSNTELVGWVAACFEQVEKMTQAWDLNSLLLKPCQRLLKYPLLIEGLIKSSDPDHPDLHHLSQAHDELKLINNRINDAKKRADTFRAATSEGKKEKTKGKGIGKTFVKAFIPKVDKNKAYDEADKTFKDQDYKSREQKFGGHFFQLQIVIRDFEQYLDAITEHYAQLNIVFIGFVSVCEVAPSVHPELESTWRKWAMAHFELQNKALEDHKTAVRTRVLKPVADLWEMWVAYQKTIEQRKKYLLYYVKHKQAVDRGEKVDPDLEESAKKFTTINDTLKHELPLLYERTKGLMRTLMTLFMCLQKDWYKTCSKKILPLLESEPQHTTSLRYDLESYVERFHSDYKPLQDLANRLGIVNRNLLIDISNMASPVPTMSSDGGGSSRNSSSRRTESIGSEASIMDSRNRHSGGYSGAHRARMYENPPRSLPAGPAYPSLYPNGAGRPGPGPTSLREARALSPVSDDSEATVIHHRERRNTASSRNQNFLGLDGAVDFDDRMPFGSNNFDFPPQLGPSFLAASSQPMAHSMSAPMTQSQPISLPGSHRGSGIFNSALPMSDAPTRGSVEEFPATPCETDEPEVLFLAASLFEFNIAHDRREGGIPYLVYVPGEIFDVIGMKGELWLARNQDDTTKTVGWIWEKHFARILPEDA